MVAMKIRLTRVTYGLATLAALGRRPRRRHQAALTTSPVEKEPP